MSLLYVGVVSSWDGEGLDVVLKFVCWFSLLFLRFVVVLSAFFFFSLPFDLPPT